MICKITIFLRIFVNRKKFVKFEFSIYAEIGYWRESQTRITVQPSVDRAPQPLIAATGCAVVHAGASVKMLAGWVCTSGLLLSSAFPSSEWPTQHAGYRSTDGMA